MNQILHIFRKDARHHWPEILLSCAAAFIFAWREPLRWGSSQPENGFVTALPAIFLMLVWYIAIAPVVQGESLVGDRQFWLRGPYEWKKLLAAKLLFLAVFLHAPLLLADVYLLVKSGLFSFSLLPGLLWMQLLLAVFIVLPAVVLATVTETLVQFLLSVLGIALLIGGVAWISSLDRFASLSPAEKLPEIAESIVYIVACVAVVVWQYARRKTGVSRFLVLITPLMVLGFVLLSSSPLLVKWIWPSVSTGAEARLSVTLIPAKPEKAGSRSNTRHAKDADLVPVNFSLRVSNVSPGVSVMLDGSRVEFEAADGFRWHSYWQQSPQLLRFEGQHLQARFMMKRSLAARLSAAPVHARISLAQSFYRPTASEQVKTTADEFAIPGRAECAIFFAGGPASQLVLQSTVLLASSCTGQRQFLNRCLFLSRRSAGQST
jgi:hypothetical protein